MIIFAFIVLTLMILCNAACTALLVLGMRALAPRVADLENQPPGVARGAHVDLEERVAKLETPPAPKPRRKRTKRTQSTGLGEAETEVV